MDIDAEIFEDDSFLEEFCQWASDDDFPENDASTGTTVSVPQVPESYTVTLPDPLPIICPSILAMAYALDESWDEPPAQKTSKISEEPSSTSIVNRFGMEPLTDESVKALSVLENTTANTMWAVRNFTEWMKWRNAEDPDDPVPELILYTESAIELNKRLSYFVAETRRKDGKMFPSSTITLLLQGIRRFMKSHSAGALNFLDEKNPDFSGLRSFRDNVARRLRSSGIGAELKQTEIISVQEDCELWSNRIIRSSDPK